jgi:hypothetical protein
LLDILDGGIMADAVKKVLRKVRHKFKAPEKPEPLWKKWQAEYKSQQLQQEGWERDKKIVRGYNFQKAVQARALQIEAINAEKERQAMIVETRLKNLKKARRKLAKMRNEE